MNVILIKDVPGLGFENEIVKIKNGYGRNYLIPKGYAILANSSNSKILNEILKQKKILEPDYYSEVIYWNNLHIKKY